MDLFSKSENAAQAPADSAFEQSPSKLARVSSRIGLALFGIALGLGALEIALRVFTLMPRGSEFDSLSDLRRSILSGLGSDQAESSEKGGAPRSVTLGGIIVPHPDDQIIYDLK
ncbi:MAG: hypothetical protein EBZ48_15880, partial [Proteobacteria bacterium]|nr:hypothetical protein [Pseudomonadota bacterium]